MINNFKFIKVYNVATQVFLAKIKHMKKTNVRSSH